VRAEMAERRSWRSQLCWRGSVPWAPRCDRPRAGGGAAAMTRMMPHQEVAFTDTDLYVRSPPPPEPRSTNRWPSLRLAGPSGGSFPTPASAVGSDLADAPDALAFLERGQACGSRALQEDPFQLLLLLWAQTWRMPRMPLPSWSNLAPRRRRASRRCGCAANPSALPLGLIMPTLSQLPPIPMKTRRSIVPSCQVPATWQSHGL